MESLATSTGTVDQYLLKSVRECHQQLSILMDVVAELHSTQSMLLSEDELSELYNPASVYSEVSQ